ncbi:MAG: PHP domain-containing protein [Acidianus infernus]|uniref:PHP-associated domain-containing protein n=1 Tax=Acidianus infernus TaxID=12915 RepID=UPI0022752036|nr:PHP domain-containing protein [Acidianus infernus]
MKFDFHTHTNYSDGKENPKALVEYAKRKGIYIAITDHDTSKGYEKVKEEAVIPGEEVTTQFGHVVILCNFPPNPPKDISSLVDYSKENSCIIFPSHPFDIFRKGIGNKVFEYKFDAIEIFNSKAPKSANEKASNAARELKLPGLANSDSHVKEAIGSAYNEIEISEFNIDEVLESIRKGKVKPVGIGLTITAKFKILQWYIERKI